MEAGKIEQLEKVEIAAWADFYSSADRVVAEKEKIFVDQIGNTSLTSIGTSDVLALNRVIGFGHDDPDPESTIKQILDFYRTSGAPRLFIQLSPFAPKSIIGVLEAHGFAYRNNWIKLYCSTENIPKAKTDLDIRVVDSSAGDDFSRVITEAFGWPSGGSLLLSSFVGREGWKHYIAYDGDTAAGTAAMYIDDAYAWVDFAATVADYRGRGVQSSLMARRISDAAAMGVKHLVVETAEQTAEKEAPSYRNMIRLGFEIAYTRPNYFLEF